MKAMQIAKARWFDARKSQQYKAVEEAAVKNPSENFMIIVGLVSALIVVAIKLIWGLPTG